MSDSNSSLAGYNSSVTINMVNNTGGNAIITLSHRYSDDKPQVSPDTKVANGETIKSLLVAGFNLGPGRTGRDYWWVGVQVLDGPNAGFYRSDGSADEPKKQCICRKADNKTTATFTIDTKTFLIGLLSGPCTTSLNRLSAELVDADKDL